MAVAALETSGMTLLRAPSMATVSATLRPKVLATGKTMPMEVSSLVKLRALLAVESAMMSRRSFVSSVVRPKARREPPAKAAALARSVLTAEANFSTDFCMSRISFRWKPRRASSVWRWVTSEAVNSVCLPSSLALWVSSLMPATEVRRTEARVELARWNVAMVLTAPPRTLMAAAMLRNWAATPPRNLVAELPKDLVLLVASLIPLSKSPFLSPSRTNRSPILAIVFYLFGSMFCFPVL